MTRRISLEHPGTRVLITGASSGLGAAMATQLAAHGARLALTARRAERLHDVADAARRAGAAEVVELVGGVDDAETVRAHASTVCAAFEMVDVAILNAGVGGTHDARERFDAAIVAETFATNVLGVAHWIEAVLPAMRGAGAGVIAGVSSPAGWFGFPTVSPYAASKAAVSSMLQSLRLELRGSGIDVVTVCPGFVRSEMTAHQDPRSMPGLLETADGAARMLRGIERRRRTVHFPRRLTGPLAALTRWCPEAVLERLVRRPLARLDDAPGPR